MEKPDFDLKKVVDEGCFKKCSEFLPKLRESNLAVESQVEGGQIGRWDENIEFYRGEDQGLKLAEEEGDGSVVLDVGLGVFDVKGETPSETSLKEAGVAVVDVKGDPPAEQAEQTEPLIVEVRTRRKRRKR